MDEKEAELIGMHAGDGTLYLSGKTLVWEIRGDIREKDYYRYVNNLLKDIFTIDIKPKYRGSNSYGIQTTNKAIAQFFLDKGFSPGKKAYTVRIPDYVKSASKKIKISFVRGLFDTDGCLRFEKNRTKIRYYPRIEFTSASKNLIDDLFILLADLGFKVHKWSDRGAYRLGLSGFSNLHKFMEEINPANLKHFKKYQNSKSLSRS